MARAVKRWQPIPRKPIICPVQTMGEGRCTQPVVKGQPFCERHMRKRDRKKT